MVRPIYHLQPRQNWMNDPNGPAYFGGRYHMFYQHNPAAAAWGNMTWGHAVSTDLITWEHLPHALAPTKGGPDKDGVFSGCTVVVDGKPVVLYTGVQPEVLCAATSDEVGEVYTKHAQNPILTVQNEAFTGWRDPFVWHEGGRYLMVIGSGIKGAYGFAPLYESQDLYNWKQIGELCRGAFATSGDMWECPNFIPQDGYAALMVSALPEMQVLCMDGTYKDEVFTPSNPRPYDLGDSFYAPNTLLAPDGRHLQWGWMRERGGDERRAAQGWQGMLTIPREVRVGKGGVRIMPIRELTRLRKETLVEREDFSLRSSNVLKGIRGQHLEICLTVETGAGRLHLDMLHSSASVARLVFDGYEDVLTVSTTPSEGASPHVVGGMVECEKGRVTLRIFLDGTAIEVFAGARDTLTTRAYPPEGADGLMLYAEEGTVRVHKLAIYAMGSIYSDDNLPAMG